MAKAISPTTLPEELLLQIVQQVSTETLTALARTSRVIHQSAILYLYRFVHYFPYVSELHSEHEIYAKYGQNRQLDWLSCRQTSTPIRDISCLVRTLKESPQLIALIEGASLEWCTRCVADIENVINIEDVIAQLCLILQSVPTLRIAPPRSLGNRSLRLEAALPILRLPFPIPNTVTCLDLWWPPHSNGYRDSVVDLNELYSIFSLPNLRILSIMGINWPGDDEVSVPERYGTSGITCLSFPGTIPSQTEVMEMLKWPRALKSVQFQTEETHPMHISSLRLESQAFMEAISFQQNSLEEIIISASSMDDGRRRDASTLGSLRSFPKLKRLALDQEYLAKWTCQHDHHLPQPFEVLPASLEQLILGVGEEFPWGEDPAPACALESKQWLRDIAEHKLILYPSLRSILIWESFFSVDQIETREPHHVLGDPEIRDIFQQAGIQLAYELTNECLPHFSSCCGSVDDFCCPYKPDYRAKWRRPDDPPPRKQFVP